MAAGGSYNPGSTSGVGTTTALGGTSRARDFGNNSRKGHLALINANTY